VPLPSCRCGISYIECGMTGVKNGTRKQDGGCCTLPTELYSQVLQHAGCQQGTGILCHHQTKRSPLDSLSMLSEALILRGLFAFLQGKACKCLGCLCLRSLVHILFHATVGSKRTQHQQAVNNRQH
jgi:hypothetical protein